MVRVIRRGRYRVYVYKEIGGRHSEPHCHVFWPDGETSIDLKTLTVLDGDRLPALAIELLAEFEDELWRVWKALNGKGKKS